MASDNEEEDYMSLKFLEEPEGQKELSYVEKRKKALREQEKKAYIKPRRVLEEEARQEGLKKELDDKNKGMKMLMKMGFKQGMTLGKESGIAKPIEVEIKSGRGGIGHDAQEKRLREEELEREMAKKPKIDPDQYREQIAARKREGQLQRWIIAAARIIEKLDRDKFNILWLLNPFNIPEEDPEDISEAEAAESPVAEDISRSVEDTLTGTAEAEPTATTEHEHVQKLRKLTDDEKVELSEIQARPLLSVAEQLAEQLNDLASYLRTYYYYCFWCGAKYADEEDLKNCPGPAEDDH
ncbi:hypothetical protein INT44_006064 [Umbelopsis vinacea]|uniref:G-patch domain-containing protein n=1 Tax=Umbelopsis vinacea TaxID=44442 RepID=A0A8H7UKG2_9FUNG|nr:hypothetical protein INT44_006064 [Umbelopsis vinacea]